MSDFLKQFVSDNGRFICTDQRGELAHSDDFQEIVLGSIFEVDTKPYVVESTGAVSP